jgi:hypothetical protein
MRTSPPEDTRFDLLNLRPPQRACSPSLSTTTSSVSRETRRQEDGLKPPHVVQRSPLAAPPVTEEWFFSPARCPVTQEAGIQEDGVKLGHLVQRSPSPTTASVNQEDRLQEDSLKLARFAEASLSASSPVQGDREASWPIDSGW